MIESTTTDKQRQASEFADQAAAPRHGFLREIVDFLMHNKKWWMTPIIVVLLLMGALVLLSGTAVAPFIYTLF